MAPQFVTEMSKKLRRKSVVPFFSSSTNTTDASSSESNDGTAGSGSVTPLSDLSSETALDELIRTAPGASALYPRPLLRSSSSAAINRHGTAGVPGQIPKKTCSKYAPRFINIYENTRVSQKVLLVQGIIGEDPSLAKTDGTVTVTRIDDGFPPTRWPVIESHFKSLVYLDPGPNRLRFEFSSPKLPSGGATPTHVSFLTVVMVPTANNPPLQLAIVLARNSPRRFDATPARAEREGDGLETAIAKFRMAAYLWQAFTADQMNTHNLGRRTFRFEEEWTTGTASYDDMENGAMRSEARIHIIEVDRTVEELRAMDRDLAQMREVGDDATKSQLYMEVADAVRQSFRPRAGQKHFVAAMLLDSHWDADSKHVEGHVAAGGVVGDTGLALFGSHCLQSYPSSIQDVVPAFTDCTHIDDRVFNNGGEAGRSWEVANFGIGGHLRQIGHVFGCQQQSKGMMANTSDHLLLSRTFVSREAFSTRTNSKGGIVRAKNQPRWHRLDCVRFSHHACFRLPGQQPVCADASIQAWPVEGGNLTVTAPSGIALVEVFVGDERCCSTCEEYTSDSVATATKQVTLSEMALRMKLPDPRKRGNLRVRVTSCGGGQLDIRDFRDMASCETASLKLETGKVAFRGKAVGGSSLQHAAGADTQQQDLVWSSAVINERSLAGISVYHDDAISGIEFIFDDGSSQLLGTKGQEGQTTQETFDLDADRGEFVSSLFVRAGTSINALQVVTNIGRRSPLFGSRIDGKPQTLIPPRGFTICGVAGRTTYASNTAVLESLSVVITR